MAHISVSWPTDGTKNWGTQVDANLNKIVDQVNLHDDALSGVTQGPVGPVSFRFYNGSGWPGRPIGDETNPIINISTPYPGAPAPTESIENDIWYP